MKVLMFGWEFPPHISGGLGTACFGLTHSLGKEAVDVLFVVPKLHGDEPSGNVSLISASDIRLRTNGRVSKSGSISARGTTNNPKKNFLYYLLGKSNFSTGGKRFHLHRSSVRNLGLSFSRIWRGIQRHRTLEL